MIKKYIETRAYYVCESCKSKIVMMETEYPSFVDACVYDNNKVFCSELCWEIFIKEHEYKKIISLEKWLKKEQAKNELTK